LTQIHRKNDLMFNLAQSINLAHILVVDDDKRLRLLINKYLIAKDFFVTMAATAEEARQHLEAIKYDLILLDVMMPGEDGLSFAASIRNESQVPILMLTAMADPKHRIEGLQHGVDDYMGKPFEPKEMLLRIMAILKRTHAEASSNLNTVKFGQCQYNITQNSLSRLNEFVHLTSSESDLLRALALNVNTPVARHDLISNVTLSNPRTIDVQITRLRRKIEPDPSQPRYLQTVRGKGYMLKID
jgi:two-component system phosphate regulon response regulator OmpR